MFYLLALLFALLPSYALRFKIGGWPVNLLEVLCALFIFCFFVWLEIKKLRADFFLFVKRDSRAVMLGALLFFISGAISAWIGHSQRAYGLFVVLFLLPLLIYYPAKYLLANPLNKIRFIKWALLVSAIYGAYAVLQYFTAIGLPQAWWGNALEPRRALSFFEYPNAYALFMAPLSAFLIPFMFARPALHWLYKFCYLVSLAGLFLSLSRGAWLGFAAALLVYLTIAAGNHARKIIFAFILASAILVAAVPNFRYRIYLPFVGEKSSISRLSLWNTGWKMIHDSPIAGKGLYGFKTNFEKFNTDPNLGPVNFPHNIFLNFWVETGLLGLLSFSLLFVARWFNAWKNKSLVNIGTILFFVAMLVHGMIDAPYFKNDLALLFWIVMAL